MLTDKYKSWNDLWFTHKDDDYKSAEISIKFHGSFFREFDKEFIKARCFDEINNFLYENKVNFNSVSQMMKFIDNMQSLTGILIWES